MRVINIWDLLDDNNTVFEFDSPREGIRRWFVVRDLGSSFGRTTVLSRHSGTRNDADDYARQGFIEKVHDDGTVSFDQKGKWHRGLFGELRVKDVRWTCERLSRVAPRQWEAAFRAAGYEPRVAGSSGASSGRSLKANPRPHPRPRAKPPTEARPGR